MDRKTVFKVLEERLAAARRRHMAASIRFHEILSDVPSGIPSPDGVTRVQGAARIYRRAIREVEAAQEQMTRFLLDGVVPLDFDLGRLN